VVVVTQVCKSAEAITSHARLLDEMALDWRGIDWRIIIDEIECMFAGDQRDFMDSGTGRHRAGVKDAVSTAWG